MKKHFGMLLFLACACVFSAVPALAGENIEFPGAELQLMEFNGRTHATHHFIGPDAGGTGKSKSLTGNTVIVNSGEVKGITSYHEDGDIEEGHVYGAMNFMDEEPVTGNQVIIKGGTAGPAEWMEGANGTVSGGIGSGGDVIGNSVAVSDGTVNAAIYGGYSRDEGNVTGNSVIVSGGAMNGLVVGGYGGYAANNTVTISGGTVNRSVAIGSVLGGFGLNATNNTVIIEGGTVNGDVCGGRTYLWDGNATGNTVIVSGGEVNGIIFGGNFGEGDGFSGNTLVIDGYAFSVEGAGNFENYNFVIPASAAAGGAALTVTDHAVNLDNTNIDVTGIADGVVPASGDAVILISNVSGAPKTINGADFADGKEYITSYGTWKFSTAEGKLTAMASQDGKSVDLE